MNNIENSNILILSPHTDDAEFGAGGTINKFIRHNNNIKVVAFSSARESQPKNNKKDILKIEFERSMGILNVKDFCVLDFPVRKMPSFRQEILEVLVKINKEFNPSIVITSSTMDYHQDHQTIANETIRAFKKSSSILCYEIPWNHIEFSTKAFVKLNDEDINNKINALKKYKSQRYRGNYLSAEVVKGLAYARGTQCNSKYAEAFEVVRWQI